MNGLCETIDSREALQAIIDEVANPIFVKDRHHRWVLVNEAFCLLMGKEPDELIGKSDFDFVPAEQAQVFWEKDNHVFSSGNAVDNEEKITDAQGRLRTIVTRKRLFVPRSGGPLLVAVITDITEYREAEARISHMAHHDALTGLANRVTLHAMLDQALTQRRAGDGRLALLFFDLDRFKEINDTLGHAIGDELLKLLAERVGSGLRDGDLLARLGGDEFAVLAQVSDGPGECAALATRINALASEPLDIGEHRIVVSASIGIAIAPDDGEESGLILKNADLALYRAKAAGRDTFCFFEPEMNRRMLARCELERDLRRAIVAGEFEIYYQPIVNLRDDSICGCEALLRWNHPARGMISPSDFIPLAEETGLIVQIGDWVLREATREAATWREGVRVSVNLSVAQFKNRDLAASIVRALAASGLPARNLELEITESVMIEDSAAALTILQRLRDIGVRLALDDFGSGYSSLGYLRSFAFDKLKIDRSFISRLDGSDEQATVLLRAIAGLGLGLGMQTVAEGVETAEQLSRVRAEGCTEMQGYYFCAPCRVERLRELLGPRPAIAALPEPRQIAARPRTRRKSA